MLRLVKGFLEVNPRRWCPKSKTSVLASNLCAPNCL